MNGMPSRVVNAAIQNTAATSARRGGVMLVTVSSYRHPATCWLAAAAAAGCFCFRPAKVAGPDHPDVIVETASMSSVTTPEPTYDVHPDVQVSCAWRRFSNHMPIAGLHSLATSLLHAGTTRQGS